MKPFVSLLLIIPIEFFLETKIQGCNFDCIPLTERINKKIDNSGFETIFVKKVLCFFIVLISAVSIQLSKKEENKPITCNRTIQERIESLMLFQGVQHHPGTPDEKNNPAHGRHMKQQSHFEKPFNSLIKNIEFMNIRKIF